MSKLTDYSKFDHLDSESDDEMEQQQPPLSKSSGATATDTTDTTDTAAPMDDLHPKENTDGTVVPTVSGSASSTLSIMKRQHPTLPQRYTYLHNGVAAVYEWEQSLQEVILYVPAPAFLLREPKRIVCTITSNHLQLGQLDQIVSEYQNTKSYFIDKDTWQTVNVKESTWCIEENKYIVIYLQKANKGIVWEAALKGLDTEFKTPCAMLNPTQLQEVQQQLMLERFQEENPGMDFRDAKFNGSAPDPRTFMGGVHQ
jgi:hypothetical protein